MITEFITLDLLLVVIAYFFMIHPILEDSNVKCSYREMCALAQILWAIALVTFGFYIEGAFG